MASLVINMMVPVRSVQHGIALLEVSVSLLLLSVAVLGLMSFEKSIDLCLFNTRQKLNAIRHIDEYFEQLRTRGALSELSEASVTGFDSGITSSTITNSDGVTLTSHVVTTRFDGNLKKIEVSASWIGADGETATISATTMISRFSEFDRSAIRD